MTRKLAITNGKYELFGIYFNGPKAFDRLFDAYPELPYLGKYTAPDHCDHCHVETFYGAILLKWSGTDEEAVLEGFVVIAEECAKEAFPASVEQFAKLRNFGKRHAGRRRRRASATPPAATPVSPAQVPSQGHQAAPVGKNVLVEGIVLSVKEVEHPKYGPQNKMTVQCDGYRVYSTVPAAIAPEVNLETGKGKKVRFTATVSLSKTDPDPYFAFASYPKNAQVL